MTLKKQEGVIKGTHREILFDVSYNESFEYELVSESIKFAKTYC